MSKVSIQGDQNGTGNFTIKAPNSNTDRTLTLPDEAGSVLTDVSDIESQVKTATNASGDAPVYACRAWVQLATNTIAGSANVSSATDNGTGFYTINFTTAMPDGNYSVAGSATRNNSSNSGSANNGFSARNYSNSSFNVTFYGSSDFYDPPTASFSVFR